MIVEKIQYDPVRDIAPVDQYGFIDLKSALEASIVPSQMPESDTDYNGIEDPEQVVGKPRDVFEAMEAQRAYEDAFSAAGEGEKKDE